MANLEWDNPNAPSTKFRLGSVTKQFTAASILLLEERGKLKVEDPVKKYMPDAPAAWDKVTIRHLLTHTSGHSQASPASRITAKPSHLKSRRKKKLLSFATSRLNSLPAKNGATATPAMFYWVI